MWSNILDKISFYALFVVIVLLPIFFLPFTKIAVENSKGLLLIVGLSISIIFWAAARFTDGKIVLPKSWLLLAGFGVFLSVLLSAIFSSTFGFSFFGIMLDLSSVSFILIAFLLMLFSSIILMDRKKAQMVFLGILISLGILALFQFIRTFAPNTLSLGELGSNTENLLGSWNSLGLTASLLAILSLFAFEFFAFSKMAKYLFAVLIVLGVLLSICVNFSLGFLILGIFALIIFVLKVAFTPTSAKDEEKSIKFPIFPFAVILCSLLFFMSGQFIGDFLNSHISSVNGTPVWLQNTEVAPPSFTATTWDIVGSGIKANPVFGIGPNRYSELWSKYKPVNTNATPFWNSSFGFGSGLLPTFFATTGIVGILAWLCFLALLLIYGIKILFSKIKPDFKWEIIVFFLSALFLFVASLFYSISGMMLLFAFIFSGIFVGLTSYGKSGEKITIPILSTPQKSFFSILLLVLLMVITAAACFKYIERFASISYYKSIQTAPSLEEAQLDINKALSFYQNDLYLRTQAQIYLFQLQTITDKIAKNESLSAEEQTNFTSNYQKAKDSATEATLKNPNNPLNWEMLGSIYSAVIPYGAPDAPAGAIDAYTKASILDPKNPEIKLYLSNVAILNKKISEAKNYAKEAVDLKADYVDALYLLSILEKSEGNTADALIHAEQALSILPKEQALIDNVISLQTPQKDTKKETKTPTTSTSDKSKTTPKKSTN